MFTEAVVSFAAMMLLVTHLSPKYTRRMVGYKGAFDIMLHSSILYMFWGTSTEGLLQAECAGILFSVWLRGYRWAFGYERFVAKRWVRYSGKFTSIQ